MGLTIYLKDNDKPITCTYNEWHSFRKSIMKSFILYLEEQIILDIIKSSDIRNDINDFISNYYETVNDDNINFDNFNEVFDKYYINLFILYNYYGFYIFITKEDNNSYFSVGNSYDMIKFFNLIESRVEESQKPMFNSFMSLLKFSNDNKKKVYIK